MCQNWEGLKMSQTNGGYSDESDAHRRSLTIDYSSRPIDDSAKAIDRDSPIKAGGNGVMQRWVQA